MNKLFIIITLISFSVHANFQAKVTRVIDGDTIEVINTDKNRIRIRLKDIDAPELGQAYGRKAKQHLTFLIANKRVFVIEHGKDVYNRLLGTIIHNGVDINKEMVKSGYAWVYRYKNSGNTECFIKEIHAKKEKKGLWQDSNAINPMLFRKSKTHSK